MSLLPASISTNGLLSALLFLLVGGLAAKFLLKAKGDSSVSLTDALKAFASDFKNFLANTVVILSFVGIFVLSWKVIAAGENKVALEAAKFVFGAVLPLLGTWVGTVLAHYFQKENLAAATKSITDVAQGMGASGKLADLKVKDFMIPASKIMSLGPLLTGKPDKELPLAEIMKNLKEAGLDRLPLFFGNSNSGAPEIVIHLSKMEKYLADQVLNPRAGVAIDKLTVHDLRTDPVLAPGFKSSFTLVKESATMAEAKMAMESITSAPGFPGTCYDIFVTATASAAEPVLGWITNDIINENAKL